MKISTSRDNKILKYLLPTLLWLAVWTIAACLVNKELLIPSPHAVLKKMFSLVITSAFWKAVGASLLRIFAGILTGVVLGVGLSLATVFSRSADYIFSPAIRILRTTPVASFIILILLWVKSSFVPAVVSGLMVLPVIWENTSTGLKSTDPGLLEMADVYELGFKKQLKYIYKSSAMPYFFSGLSTAIGLAWKAGVAAEVLCLPNAGLGTQVFYSKIYLDSPSLFAWTIIVVILSLLLETAVRRIFMNKLSRGEKNAD